jgi:hypothetical protein
VLLVKYGDRWLYTYDRKLGRVAAVLKLLNELHLARMEQEQ